MEDVAVSEPLVDSNQDSHTALITIVAVTSCLFMITTVIAKVFICRSAGAAIHGFDMLLFGAALVMVAQTICVVTASKLGLGKHRSEILDDEEGIRKVILPRRPHRHQLTLYPASSNMQPQFFQSWLSQPRRCRCLCLSG